MGQTIVFKYLIKRCLIAIPTLFGISFINFVLINLAPGGPVEQRLQAMQMTNSTSGGIVANVVSEDVVASLKHQYGLDKPLWLRYGIWIKRLCSLDFGESFTYEEPVTRLILRKLPVSFGFGLASLILTYLIGIPLGAIKALKNGSGFDRLSSLFLFVLLSIVPVMLAVVLIVLLGGGSFLNWFPIGGVRSDYFAELAFVAKLKDLAWHAALPLLCYTIGNFTFLTFMVKSSMLDVMEQEYIRTAKAKGLPANRVYLKHALRNALLPLVTGLTGMISIFLSGSLILEQVFSLDGMGRLGLQAISSRDYNVLMGLVFLQSLMLLFGRIATDLVYIWIDPRIDFS